MQDFGPSGRKRMEEAENSLRDLQSAQSSADAPQVCQSKHRTRVKK